MPRFQLLSRTRQITEYSCGACALHAVLSYWGKEVEEEELMRLLGTSSDVGTFPERIVRGVRALGLEAEAKEHVSLDELQRFTANGNPVIALGQVWRSERHSQPDPEKEWDCGHYITVLGVDEESVYFQDPYLRMGKGFVPRRTFEQHWHQVMGGANAKQPKLMQLGIFIRGEKPATASVRPGGERPKLDLEKLGSLNLITARFEGWLLPFDFMDELRDLWKSSDVRPAAFVVLRKSAEGEISAMTGGGLADDEDALEINVVLAAIAGRGIGEAPLAKRRVATAVRAAAAGHFGLSADDIRALAEKLAPGWSAILVLFEDTWERRFREITRKHGGEVTDQRFLSSDALKQVGQELGGSVSTKR